MKIVHIAPNAPYNEGWSYQENYLPRFQAQLGHNVILIATNLEHKDGKLNEVECTDKISSDGFRVIRLKQNKESIPRVGNMLVNLDVYEILTKERPDLVFFHGMVSTTIFQVCKYKRIINPNCVIVQDNHLDYNIGFSAPKTFKGYIKRFIYRFLFYVTKKYIDKVYGVTPWRKQYCEEYFGVPSYMSDVLIMGAADDKIHFNQKLVLRSKIRMQYNISEKEMLIVTGGKIDSKKNIHLLMNAVNDMDGVKLLVFGNILEDIHDTFFQQVSTKVLWIGFIPSDDVYNYFLAADLVVFPGQHSVLWEQACACKVPCVFKRWHGMEHVNNGGNSDFIDDISVESLREKLEELKFTDKYKRMKEIAESSKTDIYLYSNVARKSLECVKSYAVK